MLPKRLDPALCGLERFRRSTEPRLSSSDTRPVAPDQHPRVSPRYGRLQTPLTEPL